MSYDLDLFLPERDVEPIITIQQAALVRDNARTSLNSGIAYYLRADNPNFTTRATDDVIEVMDDVEGIRITLYAISAQVSIPLWFTDIAIIRVAFETARAYILIIQQHARYAVYDSQLGRVVDMTRDLPEMILAYQELMGGMQSIS